MPSAKFFAECRISSTRQRYYLPSAKKHALGEQLALGGLSLCRVPAIWHSAKTHFAECQSVDTRQRASRAPTDDPQTTVTVAMLLFAECLHGDTQQTNLCRVPYSRHSANAVTCTAPASSPRPLRCCHERSHFSTAVTVMLRRVPNWGTRQTYCNAECNGTGTRHLINFAECRLWHSANKYKNFLQQPPNFFLRSHTMWKTSYLNLANYPLCLLYLDYLFDYKNILCIIQIWTAKCCQKCW